MRNINTHFEKIRDLSKEIRLYFQTLKVNRVRRVAAGGQGADLWKAVKIAMNLNIDHIPQNMTLGGQPIAPSDTANAFAAFFNKKVQDLVNVTQPNINVYNGKNKFLSRIGTS